MRDKTIHILLAIIVVILAVNFLQATRPVSLPLAFATILVLIFVPVYRWLSRYMRGWISAIVVLLINLLVLTAMGAALTYAGTQIAGRLPELIDQSRPVIRRIPFVSFSGILPAQEGSNVEPTLSQLQTALSQVAVPISLASLVLALLVLMLLESDEFSPKVRRMFRSSNSQKILNAVRRATPKFARYMLVQVGTALLTGVLTWGWTLIMGVDLAFVWGLSSFLLNLIPTVGSVVAVLPPTLFALTFQNVGTGLIVLAGLTLIEFGVGNFVDPKLQGRALRLSAVVVLLSVVVWGWIWGIGGAIIGVPLTVVLLLFFQEYEPTQPLATMLSDMDDTDSANR